MHEPKNELYSYKLNQAEKTAEILVYGVISAENNNAHQFVTDFSKIEETADVIHIRINSQGGSVWDGLPMINSVRRSKKDTHAHIEGIAYSMGAALALAAKTVHMSPLSMLMTHNTSTTETGNAQDFRRIADELDKYDQLIAEIIAAKTGKSIEHVMANWLNHKDNYFSPQEAKEAGLIDVIDTLENSQNGDTITPENKYKKILASIHPIDRKKNEKKDMNKFLKLMTIGIKAEGDAEEVAEIAEANSEIDDLKQQLADLKDENTSFKKQIDDLKAENEELKKQLEAASEPPSAPVSSADRIFNSSEKKPFETSFDREARSN